MGFFSKLKQIKRIIIPNNVIKKESVAVILVDMQVEFVENLREGEARRIIANQLAVLSYCNKVNIPVIVLELDSHRYGKTIKILMRQVKKNSNFKIIEKRWNNGFDGTKLEKVLKSMKVKNLLVMGINADYCVKDTAYDAIQKGYNIITSNELISGQDHHSHDNSIKWFIKNGSCVDSLSVLACMVQPADT